MMCEHCGHDHDGAHNGHHHADDGSLIALEHDILGENDRLATGNRLVLREADTLALNLLSSPGAGKTTLLVRTIEALASRLPIAVIEGDQQTTRDADRIKAAGAPAIQINTGKGCHLDAHMVSHAMEALELPRGGLLFIENVGNLVCPAAFDLGEAAKVVLVSLPEGDDKPLKYPDMFAAARLVVVTKIDLAPHLDARLDVLVGNARRINPTVDILALSATTGEGLDGWLSWLTDRRPAYGATQA